MNEIIKIEDRDGMQFVDARNLHNALGVGRDFSTWITEKISRFGFVKDSDYQTCSPDLGSERHGGQNKRDYILSVNMAKELAMLENNDKGQSVRQYLIKVESAWNTPEMIMARALQVANRTLDAYRSRAIEAERKNAVLMHVRKTYTAGEVAKEIGLKSAQALNQALSDKKIQYKQNGTWLPCAKYAENGYFEIKQQELDNGQVIYDRRITQTGREFIVNLFGEN